MQQKITKGEAWRLLSKEFRQRKIENPLLDAKILAKYAFGLTDIELALKEQEIATIKQLEKLQQLGNYRLAGEPIARILEEKEFYGLNFKLNKATLIPRPETELLVDLAIFYIKQKQQEGKKKINFLELGTGSGCISISILANSNNISAIATDINKEAIKIAKQNAIYHNQNKQINFLLGNWFDPLKPDMQFDLILSNPPYIATEKIKKLSLEVRKFDPFLALNGGEDGLEAYRIIASNAKKFLKQNGIIILEFGKGQEEEIIRIFASEGFANFSLKKDLANINRAIILQKI